MKIAMITSGFLPVVDGVTVTLWHRLQQLSDRQHEVMVFCPDYRMLETVYPDWSTYHGNILPGVTVINLPSVAFMDLDFERNISRRSYPLLLRQLETFQPDLVHVDEPDRLFLSLFTYPGVDYARRANIPCVGFFHTNFVDYIDDYIALPSLIMAGVKSFSRYLIARNYNAYSVTLTGSAETGRKLRTMGIRRVVVDEFLGVDLDQFTPELRGDRFFQQTYGLDGVDDKIKLIFLGRLTPDKGWNFTLDALSQLPSAARQSIAILIVGDGPLRDRITAQLAALGITAACLGRIAPDRVPAVLSNSDLHITTSEKETKGLTVLEAFAAGIPVLAPRAGGIIDSVMDGGNGYLFRPGNAAEFLDKLTELLDNPALRQTLGRNARASVTHCTWSHAVDRLLHIWTEQINQHRAATG
jgi:glycosyltransferase involved in cell wall biosynthesis